MNRLALFLLLGLVAPAAAQPADALLAGQRAPAQITVLPVYQSFTLGEQTITQISLPLQVYVPLQRNVGLSLRAAWAQASGDGIADLAGPADTQAFLSYYLPIGAGSVVLGLGLNLPSGKKALTQQEFATLALLSRNAFDFQTPSLGLGLGLTPGLTLAFPLSDEVVVGIGAAFQWRGAFDPLENMPNAYEPGNELLVTGGLDVQLSRTVTFAADVVYTTYQPDVIGGAEIFEAGDRLVAGGQLRYAGRTQEAWLVGRYRSRSKNSVAAAGGALVEEVEKSLPDQIEVQAGVRARLGRSFTAGILGEARQFDGSPGIPVVEAVYGAGVEGALHVSRRLQVPARFVYHFGDLTGMEAAMGMRVRM